MKSPVNPSLEMNKMVLPYGEIEIEYCSESGGVWLDKGELEKLINVVEPKAQDKYGNNNAPTFGSDNTPRMQSYSNNREDDYKSNQYPKKNKKESILGELFDIF